MVDSNGKRKRAESKSTTGMVWGASAPSSLKCSASKSSNMGDFGKYMAEKQRKLKAQFEGDTSRTLSSSAAEDSCGQLPASCTHQDVTTHTLNSNSAKTLFEGISIFVNGYTIPSHQELRFLMIQYGGRFQNYFSRDNATHIICSTLPDSKIKDPRSFSRGLPIVKPNWVVDSIAVGKVLPLSSYYLERLAFECPNQSTLSKFLVTKNDEEGSARVRRSDPSTLQELELIVRQDECEPSNSLQQETYGSLEDHYLLDVMKITASANVKGDSDNNSSLQGMENRDNICQIDCLVEHDGVGSSMKPNMQCSRKKSSVVQQSALHTRHCSLGDSNFVQNFFKNSRLHFIGTWRTRYYNQLASQLHKEEDGFKCDVLPNKVSISSIPIIMHIDMDCFFVSVVVRNRPLLKGKPVAVCHSDNALGTAEISSANYSARAFGVGAGMFVRDAKGLCPDLEIVPYDFEGYEQVADQFYDILHKHCSKVQAISCDEAYLDVTGLGDPRCLASIIRSDIFKVTKCTASVGIAGSLLLARLATRKAKPDGLHYVELEQVDEFISNLSIDDLPGVGWAMQEKLHQENIYSCKQLQAMPKEVLQNEYGSKTGEMLWSYARGIDNRQVQVTHERKSIGAEVNWGVRFKCQDDAQRFLADLCEEVCARLRSATTSGRTFTLKIKKRKEGASEPVKFMGCGSCDSISKSLTVDSASDEVDVLLRISRQLFALFHLDVQDIRGMGLQVTKLVPAVISKKTRARQQDQKALKSWLASTSKETSIKNASGNRLSGPVSIHWGLKGEDLKTRWSLGKVLKGPFSGHKQQKPGKVKGKQKNVLEPRLPPLSELDHSVLPSLPPEILREIDEAYNGAVAEYFSGSSNSDHDADERSKLFDMGSSCEKRNPLPISCCLSETFLEKDESGFAKGLIEKGNKQVRAVKGGELVGIDPMPLSMTQVDMATLKELPSQVQEDIFTALPAHRHRELKNKCEKTSCENVCVSHTSSASKVRCEFERNVLAVLDNSFNYGCQSVEPLLFSDLWLGSPPKWVALTKEIQGRGSSLLNRLAECYLNCSSSQNLSSALLNLMSFHPSDHILEVMEVDESLQYVVDVLREYFQLKVVWNVEEVFMVLRLLKRLTVKSQFWVAVYDHILPTVQAMIGESYGGSLAL